MSRDKREAESVGAVETPAGAHDAHLVGQEVPSQTCQNKSEQEVAESARSSSHIA
jgi:hypothetical protein